jgi:proteasome lid subunit RPN8/RPN11
LEIIGIWHSHPDHPARPSETDRAAAWEGWSYLIASVTKHGVADLRSWRLQGKDFVEENITL